MTDSFSPEPLIRIVDDEPEVDEGLGFLLSFEGLVDTGETSPLTCRPLDPPLTARSYLIRRKNATVTPIAERFLAVLRELVSPRESRR